MTLDELADECWAELPPVRRWMAGRGTVKKVLADSLVELDVAMLQRCATADEQSAYEDRLRAKVNRRNAIDPDKDGFVVLTFLLATVAAAVISWLIQRWLDNRFPSRADIEGVKANLT